jgi:hypothetical protein
MNNKKSKYEFLSSEIIDNYFTPDIELAKVFISKYKIDTKRKNLENYIFRIKGQHSIISVLNSKIKKLSSENKQPSEIKLNNRYFTKFISEYEERYGSTEEEVPTLDYDNFLVMITENINGVEPIKFKYNDGSEFKLKDQTDKEFIFSKKVSEFEERILKIPYNVAPTLEHAKQYLTFSKTESSEKSKNDEEETKIEKPKQVSSKKETPIQNENVLIVGDLHLPFEHKDYLNFCTRIQRKYDSTKIIFIGDIIDNHYQSFHPTDPDGYSAGEELRRTKDKIKAWYKAFPEATVIIGNHDLIVQRRAFDQGLSREWIRGLGEVLNVPNWKFKIQEEYNGVVYIHGTGTSGVNSAYDKSLYGRKPIVQGHLHTIASISYVNQNDFGMIVGCGIDFNKYAFNYARASKKPNILSCGVVTNERVPILETMKI